jgi:hypothetical protein
MLTMMFTGRSSRQGVKVSYVTVDSQRDRGMANATAWLVGVVFLSAQAGLAADSPNAATTVTPPRGDITVEFQRNGHEAKRQIWLRYAAAEPQMLYEYDRDENHRRADTRTAPAGF